MDPESRPRGSRSEGKVYRHASPPSKQIRFPPRRKLMRSDGKPRRQQESVALKQQTLTQIDWVPGLGGDPLHLSDSEPEGNGDEDAKKSADHDGDSEEDDFPHCAAKRRTRRSIQAYKRRFVSVDDGNKAPKRKSGHEQAGASGTATSSLHTQTLTQFLGRDLPADALNFAENGDDDQGFSDWLGISGTGHDGLESPQSGFHQQRTEVIASDDEDLVIPQTPTKPRTASKERDSSGNGASTTHPQNSGIADDEPPPLRQRDIPDEAPTVAQIGKDTMRQQPDSSSTQAIDDSLNTESWNIETPPRQADFQSHSAKNQDASCLPTDTTPRALDLTGEKQALSSENNRTVRFIYNGIQSASSIIDARASLSFKEIPDSEAEEDEEDDHVSMLDDGSQCRGDAYIAGAETQLILEQLACEHQPGKISNADSELTFAISTASPMTACENRCSEQVTRNEKQSNKDQDFQKLFQSSRQAISGEDKKKPLRRPLPRIAHDPSQFIESQRVAIQVLQAFPPASVRSDIILPIASDILESVLRGCKLDLCIPHKIPDQVVRFWLFDGSLLSYMACVQPGKPRGSDWTYAVDQVYELNNPVTGEDMREEGWADGQIKRYIYLPPAVVGQLLWNLQHAIFGDESSQQSQAQKNITSPTIIRQATHRAQTTDDISPSTRTVIGINERSPSPTPEQPAKAVNLTGETTASLSTTLPPASQQHSSVHQTEASIPSSLVFQDHEESNVTPLHDVQLNSSQLLTKSQMLPESLLRDGPGLPQEIWDSDDEFDY